MKQTVANKQILEKDYQKLNEYYNSAKVCSKCTLLLEIYVYIIASACIGNEQVQFMYIVYTTIIFM